MLNLILKRLYGNVYNIGKVNSDFRHALGWEKQVIVVNIVKFNIYVNCMKRRNFANCKKNHSINTLV
jgi:hypothetical protein